MSDSLLNEEELYERGMDGKGLWDLDTIVQAQDAKTRDLTLKEVGEWLWGKTTWSAPDHPHVRYGYFPEEVFESLKQGRMPEHANYLRE